MLKYTRARAYTLYISEFKFKTLDKKLLSMCLSLTWLTSYFFTCVLAGESLLFNLYISYYSIAKSLNPGFWGFFPCRTYLICLCSCYLGFPQPCLTSEQKMNNKTKNFPSWSYCNSFRINRKKLTNNKPHFLHKSTKKLVFLQWSQEYSLFFLVVNLWHENFFHFCIPNQHFYFPKKALPTKQMPCELMVS